MLSQKGVYSLGTYTAAKKEETTPKNKARLKTDAPVILKDQEISKEDVAIEFKGRGAEYFARRGEKPYP